MLPPALTSIQRFTSIRSRLRSRCLKHSLVPSSPGSGRHTTHIQHNQHLSLSSGKAKTYQTIICHEIHSLIQDERLHLKHMDTLADITANMTSCPSIPHFTQTIIDKYTQHESKWSRILPRMSRNRQRLMPFPSLSLYPTPLRHRLPL